MHIKPLVALLMIVLIPLGTAGWFGLQSAAQEQERNERRFRDLQRQRLQDTARLIDQVVDQYRRTLLEDTASLVRMSPSALHDTPLAHPYITQVFLLARSGELRHPDPEERLSRREQAFVERTRSIWESRALLHQASGRQNTPHDRMPAVRASGPRDPPPSSIGERYGWYSWHWGNGLNLLFWRHLPGGGIAGAELERLGLLADVIAQLPDNRDTAANERIRLLDSRNRILYQWGDLEPAEDATPDAELTLEPPLESWRLDYHTGTRSAVGGQAARFQIVSGLAALALVVILGLIYLYRELTRTMREASQRVNFVNQVSHELKTPLTNIRMYAELLRADLEDQPEEGRANVIVSETQRLSRLIGNVLNFARGRRNTLRLHPVEMTLDDCVETVLDAFQPSLEQQGIRLEARLEAPSPLDLDPDAISQIIGNLLSNVEKYAAEGGLVSVTTRQNEQGVELEVSDHGPGIAAAHRKRLFQPFYRIRNDLTEGVSGTGIGLAISRELARLHGGDLVLARAEHGACFIMTLPGDNA